MAGLTCPNCNAVASPAELAAGWCDTCGKKIPASYVATYTKPKRSARDAYLAPTTPRATRARKRMLGTIICTVVGVLIAGILMIGPLREAGYIFILLVTFAVMLAALSVGQICDGMFAKEGK